MAPPPKAAAPVSTKPEGSKPKKADKEEMVGKPDQNKYNTEQDGFRSEIDALQTKLNEVKDKINRATNNGSNSAGNSRRNELKAEMDAIRGQQGDAKQSRGKLMDELKKVRDDMHKKINDLNASKKKLSYKSVDEVDAQIKYLDSQVEGGQLTIAAEKKALNEITSLKRSRRTVEAFSSVEDAIQADKTRAEELSAQLDDPELKAVGERFDKLKLEMAEIQKEGDALYEQRNQLYDERRSLSDQLNEVHGRRKESSAKYKEAQDLYWTRVQEDRARKAERYKADKKAADDARKLETATRLRDEAKIPAFGAQIEDCQTIIDYLSGKSTATPGSATPLLERKDVEGVEKKVGRQVAVDEGLVAMKKKGGEEESFFGGGGGKKKGSQQKKKTTLPTSSPAAAPSPPPEKADGKLNLPFSVLSAILSLSIPPPTSTSDVPRTIEDLKTKKSWFEVNNEKVTRENVAKAEKEIRRLEGKAANGTAAASSSSSPNGNSNEDEEEEEGEKKPVAAPVDEEKAGAVEPEHTPAPGVADGVEVTKPAGEALPSEPSIEEVKDEAESPKEVSKLDAELADVAKEEEAKEE